MKIFVYGTLKRGKYNHSRLEEVEAQYLGTTRIKGALYVGTIPVVCLDKPGKVLGEVYEIPSAEGLRYLDRFEGAPSFYSRDAIPTEFGDCSIYHMPFKRMTRNLKNKTLMVKGVY